MPAAAMVAALVDELGDIEAELAPFKAKIKRAEALRAAIRGSYASSPAASSFTVTGSRWSALLGACGNESIVDKSKLFELAGAESFIASASISLKALEAHCSAAMRGAVVSTQMSGSRPLSLVALAPPDPVPAKGRKRAGK